MKIILAVVVLLVLGAAFLVAQAKGGGTGANRSHSRAKDQVRDSRLEQAGIRTVRFESRNKPTAETIRTMIVGPVPVEQAPAAAAPHAMPTP